jgi:hypothetical protein
MVVPAPTFLLAKDKRLNSSTIFAARKSSLDYFPPANSKSRTT